MPIFGLAIETSGRQGSIALMVDGEAAVVRDFPHGLHHAAKILPLISEALTAQRIAADRVDELYVSIGPGSFTGLRIAVTLAKTWWLVHRTRVVAVPSARALVENLGPEVSHAATVLDAKRGQVFTATFARNALGEWNEVSRVRLDTVPNVIAAGPGPLTLIGEGLAHYPAEVTAAALRAAEDLWSSRAEAVGRLGYGLARLGKFADVSRLTPEYVRIPEAEEKWQDAQAASARLEGGGV